MPNTYDFGRALADEHVNASMMNFEEDDDYAALAFACRKLVDLNYSQYEESLSTYSKKSMGELKYASDPDLSEADEDLLLGFTARCNEIMKLSTDGYVYHRVRDESKATGWDYQLERADD